jgi:hypothetical protein
MHFQKPLAPPVEHVGSQKHWSAFFVFTRLPAALKQATTSGVGT